MFAVNKEEVMDRYFQDLIDEFGEPTTSVKVDPAHIESFKGKLPNKLLEFWQQFGFCGFKKGLFWIVDPSKYELILSSWIGDTEIIKNDTYYVIARSGFGDLYLWGTKTGFKYLIKTRNGWIIEKDGAETGINKGESDFEMQIFFATQEVEWPDIKDINTGKLLFNKTVKKFGTLKENEVFGFEPALFLGGEQTLDKLNKLDIQIHLSILADFGQRELVTKEDLARKAFGG